jgi:hypothetical protein
MLVHKVFKERPVQQDLKDFKDFKDQQEPMVLMVLMVLMVPMVLRDHKVSRAQ